MDNIEFGFAAGEDTVMCAKRADVATRMLCGQRVGSVSFLQEDVPSNLCTACRDALAGAATHLRADRPSNRLEYATCPVCCGEAEVFEGRLQAHGAFRVGPDGVGYASAQPCLGVNLRVRGRR